MKKNTNLLFLLLLSVAWCSAQELLVLSPFSSEGQSLNYQMSSTSGEPVIQSGASAHYAVTQGFQQPDYKEGVPTREIDREHWQLTIFPNPAINHLNICFLPSSGETLFLEVLEMSGKTLIPATRLPDSGSYSLVVGHLAPGAYTIRFFDEQKRQTVFLFRIVR